MSLRLTCELLEWSGRRLNDFLVTADLAAPARVSWASDDAVPRWFDLAREFTERWVNHRQICDGLGRGGGGLDQYLEVVLGGNCPWRLTRSADRWELELGGCESPAARVEMNGETAWRLLTGAPYDQTRVTQGGRPDLSDAVLAVRGVIV